MLFRLVLSVVLLFVVNCFAQCFRCCDSSVLSVLVLWVLSCHAWRFCNVERDTFALATLGRWLQNFVHNCCNFACSVCCSFLDVAAEPLAEEADGASTSVLIAYLVNGSLYRRVHGCWMCE